MNHIKTSEEIPKSVSGHEIFYETCSICCEEKLRGSEEIDSLRLKEICYECWSSHIKNYIMRVSYRAGDDVLSPFIDAGSIDIIKCINSLTFEDAKEVEEMLFRKYSSFNQEIEKCPSEKCDYVYLGDKCLWGSSDNVNHCPKCEMPLIANKSMTFKTIMASFYLMMANKCPKCDIPIEKISGCPHMTCPCGHHFCWYCYKDHPLGTRKRVYSLHTVPECIFIFVSKIVLLLICMTSLMIAFHGNWVLKYISSMISSLLSVIFRAAILDGAILIQFMLFIMRKGRRNIRNSKKEIIRIAAFIVIINLLAILSLYLLEELEFFLMILVGEFLIACAGFSIGYGVFFTLETWFEFVA